MMRRIQFLSSLVGLLLLFASCEDEKVRTPLEIPEDFIESDILQLIYSDSVQSVLNNYREIALKQKVISSDLKKELPATLIYGKDTFKVSIRFKGDWTDHLNTDKWSFRIKIEEEKTLFGIKNFSIQNPETRNFMREWITHKLYTKMGILNTRYDFIPVAVNNKYSGIYALEEHFDKFIVERAQKREGPLLKLNEEDLWKTRINGTGIDYPLPFYESMPVSLFKKNKTFKRPSMKRQFERGRDLLLHHKAGLIEPDEVFDMELMAKYIAVSDLTGSFHSYHFHNKRFYYNPVTDRLEPIGFDCNPEIIEAIDINRHLYFVDSARYVSKPEFFTRSVANSPKFKEIYSHTIKELVSDEFLSSFYSEIEPELTKWHTLLQKEYQDKQIDLYFLEKNAAYIKPVVPNIDTYSFEYNTYNSKYISYQDTSVFLPSVALKGMKVNNVIDSVTTVYLKNFHLADVECTGFALKRNTDSIISLPKPFKIGRFTSDQKLVKLNFPLGTDRIFYKPTNVNTKLQECNLSSWQLFEPINDIEQGFSSFNSLPFKEEGNNLRLEKGSYQINNTIQVPEGYQITFEAGVELNMINGAAFVSRSPVYLKGTKQMPINIWSSDTTSMGFVVLNNGDSTAMHFTNFRNLKAMNSKGWVLTGAVTVYQSKVLIDNCKFINNHCEDGLNLIRCDFTLSNSEINTTTSDGFDGDFVRGNVINSLFLNTGNDAIDVSGSDIYVEGTTLSNIGDKAISGGEDSKVSIKKSIVNGALTAVASKDKSDVTVDGLRIDKSYTAFAVFEKKAEFGPAKINVMNSTWKNVEVFEIVDKNSMLEIDGKQTIGQHAINVDSMYAQFAPKM